MTEKWVEMQGKFEILSLSYPSSSYQGSTVFWTLQFMHNDILWPHFLKSV